MLSEGTITRESPLHLRVSVFKSVKPILQSGILGWGFHPAFTEFYLQCLPLPRFSQA